MKESILRPAWTGKRFGKLKVVGMLHTRDGDAWYLCQCDCGNKRRCTFGELKSGLAMCCERCAAEAATDPERTSDTWSFASTIDHHLLMRLNLMRDDVPSWWWACLNVVVDEMVQMLGRGTYSDPQVAKFFKCPIPVVDAVRDAYKRRIRQVNREYKQIQQQFAHIRRLPSEEINSRDVVTLLSAALSMRSLKGRFRGRNGLYGD